MLLLYFFPQNMNEESPHIITPYSYWTQ